MSADPAGKFLYVANVKNNVVAAFTINSTGQLRTVAGSPFATGEFPEGAVVDPSGKYLYVSHDDALGSISGYTINSSTGALTIIPGSPFATLEYGGPLGLAVHPNGKFLYIAMGNDHRIGAQSIDPATGALSPVLGSPFSTGNTPRSVTLDPSGKFLFSTNWLDSTVSVFTVDGNAGGLTALGKPVSTGTLPFAAVVNSTSALLFVDCGDETGGMTSISAFTISSSGTLTSVAPINGGGTSSDLATSSGLAIVAHP